jgi:hypothetical protein
MVPVPVHLVLRVAGRFSAGCRFLLGVLFIDYPDGMMAQAIDALAGSAGEPFDAVARVARGDPGTVARGISGLRTQIANFKRIQDEIAFIDGGRSTLMLGEADRVSAGG